MTKSTKKKKENKMNEMKIKDGFTITDDRELSTSYLLQECRDKFPVWCYWEDEDLDKDFPRPKKATTRYFKKNVEADEENANKSADDLGKEGNEGITIRERIIMELQYFEETGKHLDLDNWTLCAGSRDRGGSVPRACWDVLFRLNWCGPSGCGPRLRSRSAFNSLPLNLVTLDLEKAIKICKNNGLKVIKEL